MKLFLFVLAGLLSPLEIYAHPEVYSCKAEDGKSSSIRLFWYDGDLMRIRFVNLEPDRYFSGLQKKIQFASRADKKAELELKRVDDSYIEVEMRFCDGPIVNWFQGKHKMTYNCLLGEKKKNCRAKAK